MMIKLLPLTALVLGLSSGVALADRHEGDHRSNGGDHRAVVDHRGEAVRDHRSNTVVVRESGGWRGHGGGNVIVRSGPYRGGYGYGNGYRAGYRYHQVVRRPIFVSRPYIGHRYFDHYRRPTLVVENFAPMSGYYWVAGQWTWNGYEWLWQPGHYQPDASYVDPAYDGGYDSY